MHFVIPLVFKALVVSFVVIFVCVVPLVLNNIITLPCSFSSSTLLARDSKLQPKKLHNFSGWAQDMEKIKKNKVICNTHEKYNQPKLLRWLAMSSFIKGFFNYLNDINVIKSKTP